MKRALVAILLAGTVASPPRQPRPRATRTRLSTTSTTWHVTQLWHAGARGQGITIAEIDTGVDAELAVFRGRVLPGNRLRAARR